VTDAERRVVLAVVCVLALGAAVRVVLEKWPAVAHAPAAPAARAVNVPSRDSVPGVRRANTAPRVVDINTADLATLMTLPGIGATKARAIMEERARRRFRSTNDLLRVWGIGPATLRRLSPHVRVVRNATRDPPVPSLPPAPPRR
jgi:competence protein ComEA